MSKWSQAFRDSRWQEKRLLIMQRDNFTCRSCGKKEGVTLNVHHIYYEKNRAPWEYEDDMLITWCEDCHKKRHELQKHVLKVLAFSGTEQIDAMCFIMETMHEEVVGFSYLPHEGEKGMEVLKQIRELC